MSNLKDVADLNAPEPIASSSPEPRPAIQRNYDDMT
jgi:hypothetical protein